MLVQEKLADRVFERIELDLGHVQTMIAYRDALDALMISMNKLDRKRSAIMNESQKVTRFINSYFSTHDIK